jgi:uncharacterized protein (TIGR02145 family)
MNKQIFLAVLMIVLAFTIQAQNDTLYVMKNGNVVGKYNLNTQVDSIVFYKPQILPGNTFTDSRDGQVYRIVTIGNQVWMAENLKYLPTVIEPSTGSETTRYYYVYGYEGINETVAITTANYATYGVLYNWPAAMDGAASSTSSPSGVQGVCPSGWHLPSDAEWTALTGYLGGEDVAGGKLKETGITHWNSPNTGATNENGFSALPGGYRFFNGEFGDLGVYGAWWSTTMNDAINAWCRSMIYYGVRARRSQDFKEVGLSVRCVKN